MINPYLNPNLDADLSMTIGKRKANRKQINTENFLLKEITDNKKNSDTEDTTHDRTRSLASGENGPAPVGKRSLS